MPARRDGVTTQIIILTVSDAANDVAALIDAGADGYLLKDSRDPEVPAGGFYSQWCQRW